MFRLRLGEVKYEAIPKSLRCDEPEGHLTVVARDDQVVTGTKAWFKKNSVLYITLPGNSPDLSIFESNAHPLKKLFYTQRSKTKKEALARFSRVFERK
jgi:hypothetical protein